MALLAKRDYDAVTLQASATQTATGNGSAVRLPGMVNAIGFTLDCTAAGAESGDSLDVYIQTIIDGTSTWLDVYRFTQITGAAANKTYFGKLVATAAMSEFEVATGLGAAAGRALLGDNWRVRWVITEAGAGTGSGSGSGAAGSGAGAMANFTFSVVACPM